MNSFFDMRRLPPLNWLRSFESAARHLSFTQSAEELCLTQAAVSKHIKNLEFNLGRELFVRLPHGLELTADGAAYLPAVRDALDRLSNATVELFESRSKKQLNVRVSLVYFHCCIADRIEDFYASHPDIEINFLSYIWVDRGDLDSAVDLEIRYGTGTWENMISESLGQDSLVPVCSPMAGIQRIDDLKDHYLLHCLGYTEGWEYWLREAGYGGLQTQGNRYFDTLISAFQLAEANQGVALGRTTLLSSRLKTGALKIANDFIIPSKEAFYLMHQGEISEDSPAGIFKAWILNED